MSRWLLLLFVVVLPLQFTWSAASAYCQHERGEQQSRHVGHHFHAHEDGANKAAGSPLVADPDCATCHASGAPAIAVNPVLGDFALGSGRPAHCASTLPSSAHARTPDRPQWLRLV